MKACCLTPNEQCFHLYQSENKSYSINKCWYPIICTRPTRLVGFLYQLTETTVCGLKCRSVQTQLSWFRAKQSLVLPLNAAFLAEKKQTLPILIVFGLTRPELVPTTYHIRNEHVNHYTTDVVPWIIYLYSIRKKYMYILWYFRTCIIICCLFIQMFSS